MLRFNISQPSPAPSLLPPPLAPRALGVQGPPRADQGREPGGLAAKESLSPHGAPLRGGQRWGSAAPPRVHLAPLRKARPAASNPRVQPGLESGCSGLQAVEDICPSRFFPHSCNTRTSLSDPPGLPWSRDSGYGAETYQEREGSSAGSKSRAKKTVSAASAGSRAGSAGREISPAPSAASQLSPL